MTPPAPPGPLLRWARAMTALQRHLSEDFLGGPKIVRMATVINVQKAGTLPFVAVLMLLTGNRSVEAFVYLALHGAYGLVWLIKHFVLPDARWEVKVTIGGALVTWLLVLGLYWVAPILLITDVLGLRPPAPAWRIGLAVFVHTLGVVIMMVADAQKHFTLRHHRGLIDDGMFRHVRHPNYLGEMMVYGSYALLVGHIVPWLILAWVWTQVFLVNIVSKENSLSRYPIWPVYKSRTGLVVPRVFRR